MRKSLGFLVCGLALAGFPTSLTAQERVPESGLDVGKVVPAFNPQHVAGPDKGTTKCPP